MTHRLFLSHSSRDTEAALRLAKRIEASGEDAGISVWIDKIHLVPGRTWKAQIQSALSQSTAFAVYVGTKGVANWVEDEVSVALDLAHQDPGYPVIPVLAKDVSADALPALLRQYQGVFNVEEDPDAFVNLIRGVRRLRESVPLAVEDEPFQGLEAFDSGRAHLFFGRDEEAATVVDLLRNEQLVAVVGDSGAGKSSLVKAGVVPRFLGGALAASDRDAPDRTVWHVIETRPSSDPFEQLADSMRRLAQARGFGPQKVCELADLVRTAQATKIKDAILIAVDGPGPTDLRSAVLLVVDQFEELFTLAPVERQATFADTLIELAKPDDKTIRVILTMRWDQYALSSTAKPLYQRLEANDRRARYVLRRMSDEGLRRCVTEPLRLAGIDEPRRTALATAVLRDVGDRPSQLALLEMALRQTWVSRAESGDDLLRSYVSIGRVDGALARAADDALARLSADERNLAEALFIRLVKLGDAGGATRRIAERAELGEPRWQLAQKLASREYHRLIVTSETTAEISHEALVTSWPQYVEWLRNDQQNRRADDKRRLDRLAEEISYWKEHKEDRERTARGAELLEYQALLERRPHWLEEGERRYLEASDKEQSRRDRRGLAAKALVALAALLLVSALSSAAAIVVASPDGAWRETDVSGSLSARLVMVKGRESIRTIVQDITSELASAGQGYLTTGRILALELDLAGRTTGCLAYSFSTTDGYKLDDEQCRSRGGLGSLAKERPSTNADLQRKEKSAEEYAGFLVHTRTTPRRRIVVDDTEASRVKANRFAAAQSPAASVNLLLEFSSSYASHAVGFAQITLDGREIGVVPLRTADGGLTWTTGGMNRSLSLSQLTGVTAASPDWTTLLLSMRNNFPGGAPMRVPGGLFRSNDSGLSWAPVPLPGEWSKWSGLSGVSVHPTRRGQIAVALTPFGDGVGTRPPDVPGVILSNDDGTSWRLLDTGLRVERKAEISLAGFASSGELIAIVRADPSTRDGLYGRLVVWRPLTLLERLQGRYR